MRIGIDLDGCCYDFVGALRSWLIADERYRSVQLPDAEVWDFFERQWGMTYAEFRLHCDEAVDADYLFRLGLPMGGSVEALRRLKVDGHTLHVVTSRNYGTCSAANTEAWLLEHDVPHDSVTFTQDKTIVKVDAFIEDNVATHHALRKAGVRSYLLERPWNDDVRGGDTVASWGEFYARIADGHGQRLAVSETPPSHSVLHEAYDLVHGDRGELYGPPIEDFTRTGRIWGAILGVGDIDPALVGLCMAGVKISREVNMPHRDNLTDLAGYAETVAMVRQRQKP